MFKNIHEKYWRSSRSYLGQRWRVCWS